MNFKTKIFFIALLPVILISAAMIFVIDLQSRRMAQSQADMVGALYERLKREELENYVTLARNAIGPAYNSTLKTRRQAQLEAKAIIRKMTIGEDGYFFIYDDAGNNIVNPRLTHLVGSNWIGLEDIEGRQVIRDLIRGAKSGGEYYNFIWKKPSSGEYVEKLGYSIFLDKWGWMLGTGIYMDDVAQQVAAVKTEMMANSETTRLALLGLSFGAVLLTAIILFMARLSEQRLADARLKELTAKLVDAQEWERKRVSRELHDSISQLLVSTRYGLEAALSRSKRSREVAEPIEKSMSSLDDAIGEVRRISMALRPSVLDDMGLASAISSLGSEFERRSDIAVDANVEQVRDLLSDEAKTALYRVVQEGLTNVSKHSNAKNVSIRLKRLGGRVVLELEDDGIGLREGDRPGTAGGFGIRNMQERVDTFGGSISFSRAKTGGLAIRASLPIERQPDRIAA